MGPGCYGEDPQISNPPASISMPVTPQAARQWSDGWYQGASGYELAIEEYKQTQKPMVVYMSVGWCPYCRKFEKEVLSSPKVQDMLKDKIKVTIDPESGGRENAIAFQYGIRGFPSFFLHPPQPARAVQLYTGVSPEQFVEFFKKVLG
ncbi:MAG: thioredoxin family protein [Candidatus Omnitrophica bacterium]|nr:thioredoxin family protein [Candidatus Omnitrophota bacterium]